MTTTDYQQTLVTIIPFFASNGLRFEDRGGTYVVHFNGTIAGLTNGEAFNDLSVLAHRLAPLIQGQVQNQKNTAA